MSTYIQYEIWLFLQSFVLGAGLLLFYRLIRVIRRLFSRSSAYSGLFDILYWLVLTMLVFARIYQTNQGILRNFLFFGLLSGAFYISDLSISIRADLLQNPGNTCQIYEKIFKKAFKQVAILGEKL